MPDPTIERLVAIIEGQSEVLKQLMERQSEITKRQNELLKQLAANPERDPYRDLKVFFLGLMSAFIAGYFSHWLEVRQKEEERKLEEWERLKDWVRDGRKDDLRGTDLTPPWIWLRLRLPPRWAARLPQPRYLDLESVILGADGEQGKGANLLRAELPWISLADADLQGACLEQANLRQADLPFAHLYGANLAGANLQETDLYGADLRDAELAYANLQKANLKSTDLQGANMERASLQGTIVDDTHVEGAILWEADLRGADLRGAYGLDMANLDGAKANCKTRWPEGFAVPDTVVMAEE